MKQKSKVAFALISFCASLAFSTCSEPREHDVSTDRGSAEVVTDSIDVATGLVADKSLPLVKANCINCHSAKLITQNRATREGWKSMIVWMQQTQKLWDLGDHEDEILDYLAEHYAPDEVGRRKNLENIEWYDLP